ncbi:MAG: VOC family protein [Desulfobacterales bacterium]
MIEGLAHVGVAFKNLDDGIAFFEEKFGGKLVTSLGEEGKMDFGLHISAMVRVGTLMFELMEPTQEGVGPVGKFIVERGEGIHHISMKVDDYKTAKEDFEGKDMKILDAGGSMGFIHPKSAKGILVELTEM